MTDRPFDQLSEREKECLRLCYANLEIKEIAAKLGLSIHTVREHLCSARRLLRTHRSIQAARLFVAYEQEISGAPPPKRIDLERVSDDQGNAVESHHGLAARNRFNLGFLIRIAMMTAIAFGALALAGSLMVSASAITRFFEDHEIDISDPP